jgi:hypothetical protein
MSVKEFKLKNLLILIFLLVKHFKTWTIVASKKVKFVNYWVQNSCDKKNLIEKI